jgi:hypothetical protein
MPCWYSGNTVGLCLGGAVLEYRPRNRPFWLRYFVGFLSPSSKIPRLGQGLFLRNPLQFIIRQCSRHSTLYSADSEHIKDLLRLDCITQLETPWPRNC